MEIALYQEVEILPTAKAPSYAGKKGAVLGVSEEDGVLYGYAVFLHEEGEVVCFGRNDVKPTGVRFKHEDFYDGSRIGVSCQGEITSVDIRDQSEG